MNPNSAVVTCWPHQLRVALHNVRVCAYTPCTLYGIELCCRFDALCGCLTRVRVVWPLRDSEELVALRTPEKRPKLAQSQTPSSVAQLPSWSLDVHRAQARDRAVTTATTAKVGWKTHFESFVVRAISSKFDFRSNFNTDSAHVAPRAGEGECRTLSMQGVGVR